MSLLTEPPRSAVPTAPAIASAGAREETDALLSEAFGFTISHRGREEEMVMGDITLCCSTAYSCSGAGGSKVD